MWYIFCPILDKHVLTLSRRYVDPSHRHIWYLHLTFSFVRCQTGEGLDLQTNLAPIFGFAGGTFFKISLWNNTLQSPRHPSDILEISWFSHFLFLFCLANHMHLSHCINLPLAKFYGYDGFIRVKILAGWGKTLGKHPILTNQAYSKAQLRHPGILLSKLLHANWHTQNWSNSKLVPFLLCFQFLDANAVSI